MEIGAFGSVILSVAMLAAFVLLWSGVKLALRPDERRRGVLMIIAALVIIGNVLIWAWPVGRS
jgi:hypothetical protein